MDHSGFQELLEEFHLEARERSDEVESLMLGMVPADPEARRTALVQVKRELHTLKGNAGMMGFSDLQQLAHLLEDEVDTIDLEEPYVDDILEGIDLLRKALEAVRAPAAGGEPAGASSPQSAAEVPGAKAPGIESDGDPGGGSVRIPFSKIDQLVEIQAETLIFRNRLSDAILRGTAQARDPVDDSEAYREGLIAALEEVEEARQALEKTLNLLQEHVTNLGMVPFQGLFRSLKRVVYDESVREDKKVELEVVGGDTPIDKALLEVANEVLGHLVRNAVIHGVEAPGVRTRHGKPETGKVRVTAALGGGEVRIVVADDGGGVDFEALRRKAGDLGGGIGDSRYDLLFADGLSTRTDADLGAGRGMGLSAVKKSVEAHSGRIEVHSERGKGSAFTLRLPLTTSILRSLLLSVDGEEYALPLTAVTESQRLEELRHHRLNHAPVVPWRGRLIPLLDLGLAFGTAEDVRESGYFIVIKVNGRYRGLGVDGIVGIRDIVVKGLDRVVGRPAGVSGSTILGDGRVIMILDPNTLAEMPPFVGVGTMSRQGQLRQGK